MSEEKVEGRPDQEHPQPGVSTPPGESYMDKIQESVQETGEGPGGENISMNTTGDAVKAVQVEEDADDLLSPEEVDREPEQVKPEVVIFVPFEDFDGRINQLDFSFRKDVPTQIKREDANTFLDAKKGWIKE